LSSVPLDLAIFLEEGLFSKTCDVSVIEKLFVRLGRVFADERSKVTDGRCPGAPGRKEQRERERASTAS